MAKKIKRSRRKARRKAAKFKARQQQVPYAPKTAVKQKVPSAAKVDLAQEYYYVIDDLRRIAITAMVMFALLFALAFVLQ